jgi:ERI1 exoribonuclease 3
MAHKASHKDSAPASSTLSGPLDFVCVLDFEAVCDDGKKLFPQEIIEFPVILYDLRDRSVVAEFHTYVKPQVHTTLTPFCTQLTGITQPMVDAGITIQQAHERLLQWLQRHGLDPVNPNASGRSFAFVTCGDWDLKSCLPPVLKYFSLPALPCFNRWINLKVAFKSLYGKPARGMTEMLDILQIPLVGRHHSGIDDSRNIAAVLVRMLTDGYKPAITGWL